MSDIWNDLTDSFSKDMAIEEMRKKYENTILILVKPDGKEHLVTYRGFGDGFHYFKDISGVDIRLRHETDCKVICRFPERLMFNHKQQALEFVRLPSRQNQRGICKNNAKIFSPVRQNWTGDSHIFDIKIVKDALYPEYPSCLEEAMKRLYNQEVISIALNEKFMVTQSFTREANKYYLFYMNKVIGYIEGDKIQIMHTLFKQEVLDNISLFKPFKIGF